MKNAHFPQSNSLMEVVICALSISSNFILTRLNMEFYLDKFADCLLSVIQMDSIAFDSQRISEDCSLFTEWSL